MLLESQNQFIEDYLKPLSRGEAREMPAGYKEMFAKWQIAYPGLAHLSPHEQAVSFADYLDGEVKKMELALVPGDTLVDQKNKKLIARGQVVLASEDGGKTFTKLVKPEDLATVKGETLHFLSPTLRGTTNDVHELMNEQVLLHVANNLSSQNYLVLHGFIQNNVIHLDVKTPRLADYNVLVDTAQKFDKPMNYVFVNKEGLSKVIPETQLDTKYGQIDYDPTLRPLSADEIKSKIIQSSGKNQKLGVLGGILSTLPSQLGKKQNNLGPAYQTLMQQNTSMLGQAAAFGNAAFGDLQNKANAFQNVIDAKNRFVSSKQTPAQKAKTEQEKQQKDESDSRKQIKAQIELKEKEKNKTRIHPDTKRAAKTGVGIGAAIMASLGGVVGATTFFTTVIK